MITEPKPYIQEVEFKKVADPVVEYMSKEQLKTAIEKTKSAMKKAAKDLDFVEAARLRDEMKEMEKHL